MADDTEDPPLSSDQKAAKKAADDHKKEISAALLAALLSLRSQFVMTVWWLPASWNEFKEAAGAAIDPAFNAFDKAARAVWMGFDSLDSASLEMQRRQKEKFVQEFGDSTKRAVEKVFTWAQENGISSADTEIILSHLVGVNGNQAGAILSNWILLQETGTSPGLLDQMLSDAAEKALKDRVKIITDDVLWDAIQAGRVAGGMQEQRATNAEIIKSWYTAGDERVCSVCGPLHGTQQPIGQPFPGGFMSPKAHSLCRCWVIISTAEEGNF
jgi:hypothetical protein